MEPPQDRVNGVNGRADVVLWPLQNGVLNFVGYDLLPHFNAPGPARADDTTRAAMLDAWALRLREIDRTPKLESHSLEDFDADAGWTRKPRTKGCTLGQTGTG